MPVPKLKVALVSLENCEFPAPSSSTTVGSGEYALNSDPRSLRSDSESTAPVCANTPSPTCPRRSFRNLPPRGTNLSVCYFRRHVNRQLHRHSQCPCCSGCATGHALSEISGWCLWPSRSQQTPQRQKLLRHSTAEFGKSSTTSSMWARL